MAAKQCTKCGEVKPATTEFFYKHAEAHLGLRPDCIACHRKKSKAYRALNAERLRKWFAKYRQENPEKKRLKDREYYERNKEKWAKSHAERMQDPLLRERQYRAIQKWRRNNKAQVNVWVRNRRSKLKNLQGSHTKHDILDLFSEQKGKCAYCCVDISLGYNVDHIIPVSKNGRNDKENLQLLCKKCNLTKNNKVTEKEEKNGRYSSVPSQLEFHRIKQ